MESKDEKLDVVLLVSRRTYSLSQKKACIEWKTTPYNTNGTRLQYPKDFEIRLVKAATAGKSLKEEFKELNIDWSFSNDIKTRARELIDNAGLTDIALYIECLGLAIIVEAHSMSPNIIEVDSLDSLKKAIM